MGTCVYHIAHRSLGQTVRSAGQNIELPNFTQALYEARELAMTRMQDEANELGATGIVGVRLEEKTHMWGDHTIEFLSLGTAVVKTEASTRSPSPRPSFPSTAEVPPSDLPEAATERLGHGAWSSALSVPDFASTLALGLEPVGFVQGYCVMQWSWYQQGTTAPFLGGYGQPVANAGSYSEVYRCPTAW